MKKTARLLITFECKRNCSYCCNKYTKIINEGTKIKDLSQLSNLEEICITGGEPLLDIARTLKIVLTLRKQNPSAKIYMYTAWFKNPNPLYMTVLISLLDGIHYTLHEEATVEDISDFYHFQTMIADYPKKSFRLYIHNSVTGALILNLENWIRIEKKNWISETECELPKHETLFILDKSYLNTL